MNAPVMLGLPAMPPAAPRGVGNLRGEEKFASAEELIAQMHRDVEKARGFFQSEGAG